MMTSSHFIWPQAQERWLCVARLSGNPSSAHFEGQRARQILREARETVAEILGAHPDEVVFTSGAKESLRLANEGLLRASEVVAVADGLATAARARALWRQAQITALGFSGDDIGAPTGIGVLLLRKGVPFVPSLRGGPQEHELRAGTEPVGLIAAFAEALRCTVAQQAEKNLEAA